MSTPLSRAAATTRFTRDPRCARLDEPVAAGFTALAALVAVVASAEGELRMGRAGSGVLSCSEPLPCGALAG